MYKINHANIKEWAVSYNGPPFDGILCDPPYELGFMGKSWDSSGIAYDTEMWTDLLKLLKPGAYLLAFSGSRTYHRMAVAIEDAGFEIRDMIEWIYGSGFPKSLNIGKAVDKHDKGKSSFEGYGTALKPAHEPCVLARKPIEGTVVQNALKHGTGGLNIDKSRIISSTNASLITLPPHIQTQGRFPSNCILDASDEVVGLFPDTGKSGTAVRRNVGIPTGNNVKFNRANADMKDDVGFNDSGSAARFFYCAKASKSERNAGLEGFEPSITNDGRKKDIDNAFHNHHPTVKPLSLTKYLATLIKPPSGGRLLVPFSGSGSEMIGALQAGWEYAEGIELTEEYIPISEARIKYWLKQPEQKSLL